MSQSTNSNSTDHSTGGDVNAALMQNLSKSLDTMGNHQYKDGEPETSRLAGIIEMDKGTVDFINTFIAGFGHQFSKIFSPKIYSHTLKTVERLNERLGENALTDAGAHRTAAAVTLGVNLTAFMGESVSKLYHDMNNQSDARRDMNRALRIVYDHPSQLTQNTVILAQRRRMAKEASVTNINTMLTAVGSNLVNLYGEATNIESLRTGVHRDVVYKERDSNQTQQYKTQIEASRKAAHLPELDEKKMNQEIRKRIDKEGHGNTLWSIAGGGVLSKLFQNYAKSSQRRLEHFRQPYSAYEMIIGLEQQMGNGKGKAGHFALPGRKGGELSLEAYVAAVFEDHLKERADGDKNVVEIRDALKPDLQEVSKLIAERITKGELDPMQLIRLAGEGLVVKNDGRSIASPDEVNEIVDRMVGEKVQALQGDEKKYFPTHSFTEQNLKDDFKYLEGEERLLLASSIPDLILRRVGFKDDEIKKVQHFRASEMHKQLVAAEIKAIVARGDDAMHEAGLGQTQIKMLHRAAEAIDTGGVEALEKLLSSPSNPDGVEQVVADYVVPQLPQNKVLISTLLQEGKVEMDKLPAKEPKSTEDESSAEKVSHVEKHGLKGPKEHLMHGENDNEHSANDNDPDEKSPRPKSFAERTRSTGTHGHTSQHDGHERF